MLFSLISRVNNEIGRHWVHLSLRDKERLSMTFALSQFMLHRAPCMRRAQMTRPRSILASMKLIKFPLNPLATYFASVLTEREAMLALKRKEETKFIVISMVVVQASKSRSAVALSSTNSMPNVRVLCVRVAVWGRAVGVESGGRVS